MNLVVFHLRLLVWTLVLKLHLHDRHSCLRCSDTPAFYSGIGAQLLWHGGEKLFTRKGRCY